jgi:hypothetical protein
VGHHIPGEFSHQLSLSDVDLWTIVESDFVVEVMGDAVKHVIQEALATWDIGGVQLRRLDSCSQGD